ncbi:inositol polyphosphate 5-phosphatase [Portunus trituberculatus]|uniref:Inositol polyphosphate 5-phosphatase n=1 Tax=Portunus trituberculatus TaxID=210409 RepID=A0A5B7DPY7_PORTR|nr:inositol polyphosphate 5-phosphatase [Portunus trituberculatus]
MTASRNSICGGEHLDGQITAAMTSKILKAGKDGPGGGALKKLSPLLPHRAQLVPPQVKRSSSMTRFTEALNQVHNVCLFPAQSASMVQKSEAQSEKSSPKSSASESEVNGSVPLTPLTASTSRTDQMHTQSPKLEQNRLNRSPSWYAYKIPRSPADSERSEDHSVPAAPLQGCRSASLDELNNIGVSYGLPIISPLDAKKKNYLFGGLNSLLGASELDRYFPNRTINLFIATWNMNGKEPPANLEAFLLPDEMEHMPDMFVLGTQESGGSRSEWEVRLQATIGPSHVLFTSAIFGVLHLTIFLRRDLVWFCSVPEDATYSLRPGIAYKTKGGMAIGFQFFGTRMLFINSHLTAHEEKQALRIQNFRSISRSLDIPRLLPTKIKHKDVTHRYDCVFWLGDLNFRLAVNRDHVFERLKTDTADTYQHLLQWDQLSQARKKGEAFADFEEGTIHFPPTFKYDPGTDHYDTSSKQRVPSYTDRILFKSKRGDISCISYASCPLFRTSDHKPVLGHFTCKIRPGKDDIPLAAGVFNRDVYLEALRRRRRFLYQPALRNCPVQ